VICEEHIVVGGFLHYKRTTFMEKEISFQNIRNNSIMNSILQKDKRKKE
jgi:hypothetical protein